MSLLFSTVLRDLAQPLYLCLPKYQAPGDKKAVAVATAIGLTYLEAQALCLSCTSVFLYSMILSNLAESEKTRHVGYRWIGGQKQNEVTRSTVYPNLNSLDSDLSTIGIEMFNAVL